MLLQRALPKKGRYILIQMDAVKPASLTTSSPIQPQNPPAQAAQVLKLVGLSQDWSRAGQQGQAVTQLSSSRKLRRTVLVARHPFRGLWKFN